MAQVFEDKERQEEEHPIHDDPLHDVKGQIDSGVGTMKREPLFEGASAGEKLPETRVGETLLTDNVQKLDSTDAAVGGASLMDTDEGKSAKEEEPVVKGDVAETFASEYKETQAEGDKKEETSSDDADSTKSASLVDDSQGNQDEQRGMKFKKISAAGIPRGKPHFRVSANHGNRGLGDSSSQQSSGLGGSGGGLCGSGLRGSSRGGLARTGSGLARTGSGIPQGNNELKDFSALLESERKASDPSLPSSTDAKSVPDEKQGESLSERASKSKDVAGEKNSSTTEVTGDKLSAAKDTIAEKATAAKDVLVEKAGDLKTGIVATLKDQLLPVKDTDQSTSYMEVDENLGAK